ncbi:MAG: formylmethanofuran--tetrahydromethanopterin N-formyltransferase [Candidatus Thorarchaeota archaeon]
MTDNKIEDTYSECFQMWHSRILITAADKDLVIAAANSTVGFATSIIMCSAEAGIERFVESADTPDGRPGVIIQIWTRKSSKLKDELLSRLSQSALTAPTTNIFNALESGAKSEPIGKLISYFGDGYQKQVDIYNRKMWKIPVMDGDFYIEETYHMEKGIAGGVLILIGETAQDTLNATREGIKALQESGSMAITSFPSGICRAGSKIGSKYSFLNESTNHKFCPTIKKNISDSLLPNNANCAYEIVINAVNETELRKAMKSIINVVKNDSRIIRITSSNYEGQLGSITIPLKEL